MVATGAPPAAPARERTHEELESIFFRHDAPFAFVGLDAMWSNGRQLLERAAGTPIRVATKSVRCRALLEAILRRDPGFRGLITFTLPESLWRSAGGRRGVQTPVLGPKAASLRIGANVYLRHAKAGELCERFQSLYLLSGGQVVDEVPTYRGESRAEL